MRLLNILDFKFKQFLTRAPPYAILSHRWTDSEPTLADIEQRCGTRFAGYAKVYGFAQYIRTHLPQLEWIWVDSCCIKQDSAAELSEGVNCMFEWYQNAAVCIAYLPDVKDPSDRDALTGSVWFTRGWTLQELLASTVVIFLTNTWQVIGHKGKAEHLQSLQDGLSLGLNLEPILSMRTSITEAVLHDFSNSRSLSIAEKMRWMEGRETLREEDMFYALFGISGVAPGANYGEKKSGAEQRLLTAIEQKERLKVGQSAQGWSERSHFPLHNVPFPRDPAYVDRQEMVDIQQKLAAPGARVALVGLGGIGKSQTAIEYCYRLGDSSPATWALWLHASNAARFDEDVRKLANDVEIPGRQEKTANIYLLVYNWLVDRRKRWFIALDNADDADFLFEPPPTNSEDGNTRPRIEYFPVCSHGSMLVTTRRQAIALRLVDRHHLITLQPDKDHATALLKSKLEEQDDITTMEKLAAALEYMPLAIAQAAAYIQKRSPLCSATEYLRKLEKSDRSRANLLQVESAELRRDSREAKGSILLTWQISFEHINATRKSAADLLSLMCFFDYQGIPQFLIESDNAEKGSTILSEDEDGDADDSSDDSAAHNPLEDDIATLRDFSFISVAPGGSTFEMHRLVQLATQVWLKDMRRYEWWEAQSLQRLNTAHPDGEYEHWPKCRSLYPHVRLAMNSKTKDRDASLSLAAIFHKAAEFANSQMSLNPETEKMARRSMNIHMSILGEEHLSTLNSTATLAELFSNQGRFKEAEVLEVKVMGTRKILLGPEHLDTLKSMTHLGMTYNHQGRWREAQELLVKTIAIERIALGPEHLETLDSMSCLASTYSRLGRWEEAERLGTEVVETMKRVQGLEHPDTLTTMSNLALTFNSRKRWEEAEELITEVIEISKRIQGLEHPYTLTSMSVLASTYYKQERWEEAVELNTEVAEMRKRILGQEHPQTLTAMNNLALIYYYQGLWKEAEEITTKVIETRKSVLGPEHPETLTSMHNLAATYFDQGRMQEAQDLMTVCAELRARVLGASHPDTGDSVSWLGIIGSRIKNVSNEKTLSGYG